MDTQLEGYEWSPWLRGMLSPEQINKLRSMGRHAVPDEIWMNDIYEVWITNLPDHDGWPACKWLSIKHRAKLPIHDWRHLQRIKSELVGRENEGMELYPAESRHVDAANQYHLFVFADPTIRFPFGFRDRLVQAPGNRNDGSRQRPFDITHQPPDDA